jgi:hypothetical protein
MNIQRDTKGAPILVRVGARVNNLERMLEHRQKQLRAGTCSPGTAKWFEEEIEALEVALAALTYHQAVMQGLPEFVSALRTIVECQNDTGKLKAAAKRAELVLQAYDQPTKAAG